jgi:hypothetical protein
MTLTLPFLEFHLLNSVARALNERPQKTLNYETPADRFNQCVASTGRVQSTAVVRESLLLARGSRNKQ